MSMAAGVMPVKSAIAGTLWRTGLSCVEVVGTPRAGCGVSLRAEDYALGAGPQSTRPSSHRSPSAPRARKLSPGCRACVGSTRCQRSGCVPRSDEWGRFNHPDQLAAYLGIVPCEHTTGAQRRLGSITKAGSTHARRLLIEAAHHYRRQPGVGEALERRQRDQPAAADQHRLARAMTPGQCDRPDPAVRAPECAFGFAHQRERRHVALSARSG